MYMHYIHYLKNIKPFANVRAEPTFTKFKKEAEIVDFIQLITKASKNGKTIFDARYHTFIRTLTGAFITLNPNKQLRLSNHKNIDDLTAFEIGVCKFCNNIYIIGKMVNNHLYQNDDIDIYEDYGDNEYIQLDYFLIKELVAEQEVDMEQCEAYVVCSKCGTLYLKSNLNSEICDCGVKYQVDLLRIKNDTSETRSNIYSCPCCGGSSKVGGGVVSGFHLGKDQVTALLSQILYKVIGSDFKIEEEEEESIKSNINFNPFESVPEQQNQDKEVKQFLAFSDSRQQARLFATFFNYNHLRFLRKRLIWEELIKNGHIPIKVSTLVNKLGNVIENNQLFGDDVNFHGQAWNPVLYELLNVDGNYSAEGLGLLS